MTGEELKEEQKKLEAEKKKLEAEKKRKDQSSLLSYYLVVIMLVILGVLVVFLLIMPSFNSKDLTEYYKWALSVLVGAFGAWIGAGAAYFFGKENLQESSRSTENAMRIQQESFRRPPQIERIKDMTLTAMNPNFFFEFGDIKDIVSKKLADFNGYWFVPVVDKKTGILQDVIHAQVFWNTAFLIPEAKLSEMVLEMDKDPSLKKLHGESSFYVKASLNDKISEVLNLLYQKDAEVVIVTDEKGKPAHCLSKTDLRTFLNV